MVALANNWARMIGHQDRGLVSTIRGGGQHQTSSIYTVPVDAQGALYVPLRILTNLAQAVMRKRTYGSCVPVFCTFNVESLNEFESIAMLDLIKNVSIEEGYNS